MGAIQVLTSLVEVCVAIAFSALCCKLCCCGKATTPGAVLYNPNAQTDQDAGGFISIPLSSTTQATAPPPTYDEVDLKAKDGDGNYQRF